MNNKNKIHRRKRQSTKKMSNHGETQHKFTPLPYENKEVVKKKEERKASSTNKNRGSKTWKKK